jgi:hypothetical protein
MTNCSALHHAAGPLWLRAHRTSLSQVLDRLPPSYPRNECLCLKFNSIKWNRIGIYYIYRYVYIYIYMYISIYKYIHIYIYTSVSISLYLLYSYIYAAVSNGKRKMEALLIFVNLLAHRANGSLSFVHLFTKGQMEVNRLWTKRTFPSMVRAQLYSTNCLSSWALVNVVQIIKGLRAALQSVQFLPWLLCYSPHGVSRYTETHGFWEQLYSTWCNLPQFLSSGPHGVDKYRFEEQLYSTYLTQPASHCKTDESQVYKNTIGPDDKGYFTQQH